MVMTLASPRIDFAFNKLFGVAENKELLIALINAVVSDAAQVTDIILLNPYNDEDYRAGRTPLVIASILDIKATDKNGSQYNIELQVAGQVHYNQRILEEYSRQYPEGLVKSNYFGKPKKIISINLLNFNSFNDSSNFHHVFKLLNVSSHRRDIEDLELHFIELSKCDDDLSHIKTTLERWVNFLKKASSYNHKTFPPILKEVPAIEKAFEKLRTLSFDDDEREIYDARVKWMRDEAGIIRTAEIRDSQR